MQLAVPTRRVLRKDVEDQLRAIDDSKLHAIREVSSLRRRQSLIENHEVYIVLEGTNRKVVELATADHGLRIRSRLGLGNDFDDFYAR